jgi:tetratricopeptide (TPR) repeat protein
MRQYLILPLIASFAISCSRAFAHGDLHDRIEAISKQLADQPSNAELWLQRADVYRQHEDFGAALADLEKAERIKPDWPLVPLQRARIFFDQQKYPDGERAASDCLKLDPANPDALVLRARCRTRLNRAEDAIADYNSVLNRTNSFRPLPDLFVERARLQAGQGRLEDALRGLDDAIQRFGESPSFVLPAIEYERARGKCDAALVRLAGAEVFMSHEGYLATRGEILLQAGHCAEAKKAFESALASLKKLRPERRALPQAVELEKRLRTGLSKANVPALP